jgi:hypothetical protein
VSTFSRQLVFLIHATMCTGSPVQGSAPASSQLSCNLVGQRGVCLHYDWLLLRAGIFAMMMARWPQSTACNAVTQIGQLPASQPYTSRKIE